MDSGWVFKTYLGSDIIEEIRNVDGSVYQRITHPDGNVTIDEIQSPFWKTTPMTATINGWPLNDYNNTSFNDYNRFRNYFERKEYEDVNIYRKPSPIVGEHIVACSNEIDLMPENILKTLSAIKGKLMIDVAPIQLYKIECSMTPLVRKNIIVASKRLKMYGKKPPVIARFDEYGNRLPDEIDLGTDQGITLRIVDLGDDKKYYMELKGEEFKVTHCSPPPFEMDYYSDESSIWNKLL